MYYLYHYEWNKIKRSGWKYGNDKLKVAKSFGYKSILEAFVKLYWFSDIPINQIAKLFECTPDAIFYALHENGFPVKPQGGYHGTPIDYNDLIGKKIGMLMVADHFLKGKVHYYHCRCDCGRPTQVRRGNLIKKNSVQSCMYCRDIRNGGKRDRSKDGGKRDRSKNFKSWAGIQRDKLFM